MNRIIIILILITFVSCSETIEYCNNHDEGEIKWINDIYESSTENELLPISDFDGILQYHGTDSWGWFNHTIRVIEIDKKRIIQLFDNRKNPNSRREESIYKEFELSEKQFESLNSKIKMLFCKPGHLETGIGVDGDFYELIIKSENQLQAFKWQSIFRTKDSRELKLLKEEVTEVVGDLMNLCQFPNGSKQIIIDRNSVSDSIQIEVFLSNQFNLRKSVVFFDNRVMNQNSDGIAEFKVHKKDTVEINNRIKVEIELLNGATEEM